MYVCVFRVWNNETALRTIDQVPKLLFFCVLKTAQHEILSAHKYKNIKKFNTIFQSQISIDCYFSCS